MNVYKLTSTINKLYSVDFVFSCDYFFISLFFPFSAPSTPVSCPFSGSYVFTYINGTLGSNRCETPKSEIRACADPSKFKFVYKKCQGIPGTYDRGKCKTDSKRLKSLFYPCHIEDLQPFYCTILSQFNVRWQMHIFHNNSRSNALISSWF